MPLDGKSGGILTLTIGRRACYNEKNTERRCAMKKRSSFSEFEPDHTMLVICGEQLIEQGDYEQGIALLKKAEGQPNVDEVTLYLRLAEYYIEQNEPERGIAYLIKLCTETVDNYEEAIENRSLTAVWQKCRPLVEGKVPKSLGFNSPSAPLSPETCTMPIDAIMSFRDDELLPALSEHLSEMSATGEALDRLNAIELAVYDVDHWMMEMNSGGLGHYLYYHGDRLGKLEHALGLIGAEKSMALLERVKRKFPRSVPPKKLDQIQSRLDQMEEKGIDFEDEDEYYYESAEKELIECLCTFVRTNRAAFR